MESDETFAVKCRVTDSASNMVRAIQRVQQVHGSVLTFGFHRCVEREPRRKDKAQMACKITAGVHYENKDTFETPQS